MPRPIKILCWLGLVVNLWLLLGLLVIHQNVGDMPLMTAQPLLAAALMVLAPATVFIPIASRFRAPFYDLESTLGWAILLFVVTFIRPDDPIQRGQFLLLLLPLIVVMGSLFTLVAFAFGRRFSGGRRVAGEYVRARREGYLASIAIAFLVVFHSLGILGPFNALLAVTTVGLAEALLLLRGTGELGETAG